MKVSVPQILKLLPITIAFIIAVILTPLNDALFSSVNNNTQGNSFRILAYLLSCGTSVSNLGKSQNLQKLSIKNCEDERIGSNNNGKFPNFGDQIEALSSEILVSRDGKKFVVNVSWHMKMRYLLSVWGEPKWMSFDGEKIIEGKSVAP
jgi:hypothetical protein